MSLAREPSTMRWCKEMTDSSVMSQDRVKKAIGSTSWKPAHAMCWVQMGTRWDSASGKRSSSTL